MQFSRFTLLVAAALVVGPANAQTNYTSWAEGALSTLQQWYNETSGLWDTAGWWNGANCMTVIGDLTMVDDSVLATATSVFASTYTKAPAVNPSNELYKISIPRLVRTFYEDPPWTIISSNSTMDSHSESQIQQFIKTYDTLDDLDDFDDKLTSHGVRNTNKYDRVLESDGSSSQPNQSTGGNAAGFLDSCYDDNAWWALAWIGAYDLTNNSDYLDTASGIFTNLTGSWPTNCSNGGIYWCATSTYINAIANELFLSLAAHLANRIPSNKDYYVDWAQREWAWFQSVQMINDQGTINDGLGATTCTGNRSATVWSYNQGVILGGLVELNTAAPNTSYIDSANAIAQAAIANLTDANMILHDVCEPDCAPDATQFKGVFMRNLQALQKVSPNDLYVQVIEANANSIWANDRLESNGSLSVDWAGPVVGWVNASTHSSAMGALVAAVAVS